jgi:hypothetical protein
MIMRVQKYLLLATSLFAFTVALAQGTQGSIKGKVYNSFNEPEQFVEVWVDVLGGNKRIVETDEDGWYNIKPLEVGTYTLYATMFGYDTTKISNIRVKSDEITMMNDIDLSAAVKIIFSKMIDPDDPSAIDIDAEQLAHDPNLRNPADMIANITPEIKKGDNGELYFRGARNGATIFYIDGVKLTDGLANLPGRAYAGVKVYTGGVPAQYGDTVGGVVAITTQSYSNLWRQKMEAKERALRQANQPN